MSNDNIFEFAVRSKLRFPSTKGDLNSEQLWDVPLRSSDGFNLDAIAKAVNRDVKSATEESFVTTAKTPAITRLETTLEVIKSVIATKLSEEDAAKKRAANKVEREKLLQILAEKQDGKLSDLSEKELQRRIAALET